MPEQIEELALKISLDDRAAVAGLRQLKYELAQAACAFPLLFYPIST